MEDKVNYHPLKQVACPWRYAAEGASETYGGLTAARQPEDWRELTEFSPTVEILRGRWFPPATSYRQVVKVQAVAPRGSALPLIISQKGEKSIETVC